MAINKVTGTFTATGQSSDIIINKGGRLRLSFAGTATVQLEEYSTEAGAYVPTGDVWTSDTIQVIDGDGYRLRLNCTAYTNDVVYELLQ